MIKTNTKVPYNTHPCSRPDWTASTAAKKLKLENIIQMYGKFILKMPILPQAAHEFQTNRLLCVFGSHQFDICK